MSILPVTANIETPFLCRRVEMNWKRNQQYLERNVCTPIPTLLEHWSSPNPYTSSSMLLHQLLFVSLSVSIDVPLFQSQSQSMTHFLFISLQSHSLQQQTALSVLLLSHETHCYHRQSILNPCWYPHFQKNLSYNALCHPNGRLEEHTPRISDPSSIDSS